MTGSLDPGSRGGSVVQLDVGVTGVHMVIEC